MKHNNVCFMQVPRQICDETRSVMSDGAFRMYLILKDLEQRFIDEKKNNDGWFWRTDLAIATAMNCSDRKIRRLKQELKDSGMIETTVGHVKKKDGTYSEKPVTFYHMT